MSGLKLVKNGWFERRPGPVLVVVLDGVGVGRRDESDAVHLAHTPTLDWLDRVAPRVELKAHGSAVGMPSEADMGNSEVGHNALGAGRVFAQGAKLVADAVASGRLFESEAWDEALARARGADGATLHLLGLLSDGNVHAHVDHLHAMLGAAARGGARRVRVHVLLDGRDVGAQTALEYIEPLEALLGELSGDGRDFRVASGGGRMLITMDRYGADWSMVERGWQVHVHGQGPGFPSAAAAIRAARADDPDLNDQYLPPFVVKDEAGEPVGPVRDGDAVIFFNFRGDRAIEISRAFEQDDFSPFDRSPRPDVFYAGMMQYDGDTQTPRRFLVAPPTIDRTMGEHLASMGLRQLALSETQKYGHVTYFWNGNRSGCFDPALETYVEIPSDVSGFGERPWMKAAEITDAAVDQLRRGFDFARLNYANGDMVGHTGDMQAAIVAVSAVDLALRRLLKAVRELKGVALVTADHGNADQMYYFDADGAIRRDDAGRPVPLTSHTLNPVPLWIYDPSGEGRGFKLSQRLTTPGLANVAATALDLLGFAAPEGYAPSLIEPT